MWRPHSRILLRKRNGLLNGRRKRTTGSTVATGIRSNGRSSGNGTNRMEYIAKNRRTFVAQLARGNREFYGSQDGRGLLNVIELTFDHRWVYLYELVQNALDVQARAISIRTGEDGDALIFQHNGNCSLDGEDVEGLSKVFRSTKGARSVGFMGIGFKSIFIRFHEARISGWGWKFRYEITRVIGEQFGDIQRDLLGAVIPIWDEKISPPDSGYTTRFELRQRMDNETTLESDLAQFLPENDRASLAILAMSGLECLEIDDQIWELGVSEDRDGTCEATALSDTENRLWRVFPMEFQPSREAIACFLEHRKIQPAAGDHEQVYADAARARRVLGVLPLDNDGIAAPPSRGRVYATLPTEVTLPFGLHVNADWLLNISRNGLRKIEDNAWQRDIAATIADILTHFLVWSANTHTKRDAARAAFRAIVQPSSEAGGLESLLAEESWLSRFRSQLQAAAVIPVWTESVDDLAYAKPGEVIVPPLPIAEAFANRPDLRPATLLNGPVLMQEVLGRRAQVFLRSIDVLTEMSPKNFERTWKDGLEDWWISLASDESNRRTLLFQLWAAVAELAVDDAWTNLQIRCVRSVTGAWVTVSETAFLNEALASEDEPGGRQTRHLMNLVVPNVNRLDSGWVIALRQSQRRQQEAEYAYLFRAWNWIENHARSIGLDEVVKDALGTQISSAEPDRSVFTSFGHWAKHRNRPDLLPYVLVQSDGQVLVKPTGEALLADPYVDSGHYRRHLWTDIPTIDGVYLETDPNNAGTHEWRGFFEKAGAKGQLEVRSFSETASRWQRKRVAEFLGQDSSAIPESNNSGYSLLDFDILPNLPTPDASRELRAALGPLLEDGFRILKGHGRRQISYFYRSRFRRVGAKPSIWVEKMRDLAWVPCIDGELRHPRDVLKEPDPAREDAPFAKLPPQVMAVLEQEGVDFGTTIPEATSLRRLMAVGSKLDAKELVELLSECREHLTTDTDRTLFDQALKELKLPTMGNGRVELDRIVQRVGGRLRGSLGSWITPLEQIDVSLRAELEHTTFPYEFPETTTGEQALHYVLDVWSRARSSPEGLANEVRDVLPTAYGYILDDVDKDAALLERWEGTVSQAMVFSEREWIAPNDIDNIYFDDIEDRRFLPRQGQFRTATAGHLGRNRHEQLRTSEAIRLPCLSSVVKMNWIGGDKELPTCSAWESRFDLIFDLLRSVKGTEAYEGDESDSGTGVRLFHASELALDVNVGNFPTERVPVHARLHEGTLTIAGRPVQFGADAAKELLRQFSFGQRAGLAADLTGMFVAIENGDFELAVEKFRRSHAPEYDGATSRDAETVDSKAESNAVDEDSLSSERPERGEDVQNGEIPISGAAEQFDGSSPGVETVTGASNEKHDKPADEHDRPAGSLYSRDRAMAKQNALARELKNSLKGEIVPDPDEDEQVEEISTNRDTGSSLGDEEYRKIVLRYEREAGRKPELGEPHQSGWDVRSTDPQTGNVRLIEVKGRGRPWDADEVVELSSAQVRKAFEATEHWYLYVVEKTDENSYQVLPIENPARNASKWILCGESWRMVAEDVKVVLGTPD